MASTTHQVVSEYYGKKLETTCDIKTTACAPCKVPDSQREILSKLHPAVVERFYGCGTPIPTHLTGCTILDLGCGTGRDAFLAAALAGPEGRVIGVDMTEEQLEVARQYEQLHADRFFGEGAEKTTDFRQGLIEELKEAGVEDGSVDVVISNCVCNLAPDKKVVFKEAYRVLKEGGEMYFSDMYADRRRSEEVRKHPVALGEGLGGSLYLEDFRRIMAEVGFTDVRVVDCRDIEVRDADLKKLVQGVSFYSVTVRAFKVTGLEDRRENYGQVATYVGGDDAFELDSTFEFERDVPYAIDGNTAAILKASRFAKMFQVSEPGAHLGLFDPEIEGGIFAAMMETASKGGKVCGEKTGATDTCYSSSRTAWGTRPMQATPCWATMQPGQEMKESCCAPTQANMGSASQVTSCCAPARDMGGEGANTGLAVGKKCC